MMQPLNFCRQIKKATEEYERIFSTLSSVTQAARDGLNRLMVASVGLDSATKFLLPAGGRILNDHYYKALDETLPLRLPYPIIALEYITRDPNRAIAPYEEALPVRIEKTVVFAYEDENGSTFQEAGIVVVPVVYGGEVKTGFKMWQAMPPAFLPRMNYLDRSLVNEKGMPALCAQRAPSKYTDDDYSDELGSLLDFLNALICSNVHSELLKGREKSAKHCKDALPFDDYRVLTIGNEREHATGNGVGGSHRSPREHLRRGHIVRPEGRRPYWRNATVVNAGVGGKVHKDYRMAA